MAAPNARLAQAVPLEDRQGFRIYADPAYEARHGIIDYVICRECGQYVGSRLVYQDGERGHLWRQDRMLKADYLRKYPEATLSSLRVSTADALRTGSVANASRYVANRAKEYATPEEAKDARRDPAYEARKRVADCVMCRICGFWSRADLSPDHIATHIDKKEAIFRWGARGLAKEYNLRYPGAPATIHARRAKKLGKNVNQVMVAYADSFVLPEQLRRLRRKVKSADTGEYCVCLVCGLKLKEHLQSHLKREHGMSLHEYQGTYPRAPLLCTRARDLRNLRSAKFLAAHSAKVVRELHAEIASGKERRSAAPSKKGQPAAPNIRRNTKSCIFLLARRLKPS